MIRTAVVDDHKLFRLSLARLLDAISGVQVVGEAESGEDALTLARDQQPNVMLMDLSMPGIGGLEATRRIKRLYRDVKVIALSAFQDPPFPQQALSSGASGYLSKGATMKELERAIRRVFLGQRYMSSDVAQAMALHSFDESGEGPFDTLSGREMQIAMMVVNCCKVHDIAHDLHLSPKTVNSYRYRIFEKLNVTSDVELALLAVRHGVVRPHIDGVAHPV